MNMSDDKRALLQLEISDDTKNKTFRGRNQTIVDKTSSSTVYDDGEMIFKTPCTITGITAGISSAMLGYLFGFAGYWFGQRKSGIWKESLHAGASSAKTFALLGGLYSGVSCFMSRLRQKNDALNSGVSGCSTGLALGWKSGGPIAAAQSCVMFGLFSYFLDNQSDSANAATNSLHGAKKWKSRGVRKGSVDWFLRPCFPMSNSNNYFS